MHSQSTTSKSRRVSPETAGRLLVLATALLWSTSGLYAKAPIFEAWPETVRGGLLAFWRAAFAGMLLLPAVRRPRWQWALVPMLLAFAGMNVAFMTAMSLTTAANAIWLQSTAPLWVYVFGVMILRQTVDRRELVPLVFGALGVGVILAFEFGGQTPRGNLCGLAAGICYAWVILSMRRLRHQNGPWIVAINQLTTAVLLAPWIVALGRWPSTTQLLVVAAFGFFQMAVPYVLFARGLRHITPQEAAGIVLIEPVLTPLWVYLAWGERPAWWTLVGGALILAGLVLRYLALGERFIRRHHDTLDQVA